MRGVSSLPSKSGSARTGRRSLAGPLIALAAAGFLVGCSPDPGPGPASTQWSTTLPDENPAEQRVRQGAIAAAQATLRALDLAEPPVQGSTRVLACVNTWGNDSDRRLGEYSSGSSIGPDAVTDDQLTAVATRLGVEFIEDSVDPSGSRLVGFYLPLNGADALVQLVANDDGSASLSVSTSCER